MPPQQGPTSNQGLRSVGDFGLIPLRNAMAALSEAPARTPYTSLILDERGLIRYCSNPDLFGALRHDLEGRPVGDLLPSLTLRDDRLGHEPRYSQLAATGPNWQSHIATTLDGRSLAFDVWLGPLALEGKFALFVVLRAAQEGTLSQRSLGNLLTSSAQSEDAVCVTDCAGTIVFANNAYLRLSGFDRDEVIGRTPAIVKSGIHDEAFFREMWTTLLAGREFRGVCVNRRRNGEQFREQKCIRPFVGPGGQISHFVGTGREIPDVRATSRRSAGSGGYDRLTGRHRPDFVR